MLPGGGWWQVFCWSRWRRVRCWCSRRILQQIPGMDHFIFTIINSLLFPEQKKVVIIITIWFWFVFTLSNRSRAFLCGEKANSLSDTKVKMMPKMGRLGSGCVAGSSNSDSMLNMLSLHWAMVNVLPMQIIQKTVLYVIFRMYLLFTSWSLFLVYF